MNLGQRLHDDNLKRAFEIADSIPKSADGVPRFSRNEELAKWQAAAYFLAEELRALRRGAKP